MVSRLTGTWLQRGSWILLLGALAAVSAATYLSIHFYERALLAQHPAAPQHLGAADANVQFVGDSRVSQWAPYDAFGAGYIGFPGQSSYQIAPAVRALRLEDAFVVLQLGVNELRLLGLQPHRQGEVVDATAEAIRSLAFDLSLQNKLVVVLSIFIAGEPGLARRVVWSDAIAAGIDDVNSTLAATRWPDNVRYLDVNADLSALGEGAHSDALHLTPEAYGRLNERLASVLAKGGAPDAV